MEYQVQLYSDFGGWAPMAEGIFNNLKAARDFAQLYRIEAHGKAPLRKCPKPCRILEMRVIKEWTSDAPIEI